MVFSEPLLYHLVLYVNFIWLNSIFPNKKIQNTKYFQQNKSCQLIYAKRWCVIVCICQDELKDKGYIICVFVYEWICYYVYVNMLVCDVWIYAWSKP